MYITPYVEKLQKAANFLLEKGYIVSDVSEYTIEYEKCQKNCNLLSVLEAFPQKISIYSGRYIDAPEVEIRFENNPPEIFYVGVMRNLHLFNVGEREEIIISDEKDLSKIERLYRDIEFLKENFDDITNLDSLRKNDATYSKLFSEYQINFERRRLSIYAPYEKKIKEKLKLFEIKGGILETSNKLFSEYSFLKKSILKKSIKFCIQVETGLFSEMPGVSITFPTHEFMNTSVIWTKAFMQYQKGEVYDPDNKKIKDSDFPKYLIEMIDFTIENFDKVTNYNVCVQSRDMVIRYYKEHS